MTTEEKILESAAIIRGRFINHVAFIEKNIEILIGKHFCKNDQRAGELIEMMLGDRFVSFESKRATFESILKRHHKELYNSNRDKFENLTTVQMQRNRFAHLIVFTGTVAEERFNRDGVIGFVKFEFNKTKPHWYEPKELDRITEAVNNLRVWLPTLVSNKTLS